MKSIGMFLLQASPTPIQREFDKDLLWNSLHNLWAGVLAQLPYIVIGLIVFVAFLVVARIIKRAVHAAGERTRLDLTLADLLGRLASFVITVLGLFVAAVVIFPAFKPGGDRLSRLYRRSANHYQTGTQRN